MQSFFIFKEDRMIKLNHNLSLDLYYNEEKTIDTKEYDKNSRYITVSLTYKGKEYQISGDTIKARIKWLKPDKKAIFNDCTINSNNTITIDLTEQMLIVSGVAKATLSLYDINTDQVLSTTSFNAIVEASAVSDDTILSSDEFKSVQNEFKKLDELNKIVAECENIRQKNEETRNANEDIRNTNETNRINTENTRIDSENTRIENENTRQQNEATRETQEDKRQSDTATAISNANNAAKNANDKANDLQTKLDNHHFVLTNELENSVSSTSTTHAPTANAVKITYDKAASVENVVNSNKNNWDDKYTKNEVDNKFSTLESNVDWKESVATYEDILTTYPNPEDGWTVNVKDTDYTYRYSGSAWVAISANAIPKATQSLDGLLSKEDKSNYDDANNKKHTHSNKSVLDGITSALIAAWNSAVKHITDTVKHITPSERTKWNTAYDKAINDLPLSGGTLTGSLTVQGNATDNPIRARGIVGSDGKGKDGDLYLQYGTDNNIYLGKSGKSYIDSEGYFYQIGNKVLDSKNYTSVMTKQGVCDILGYTPATETESKKYIKVYNSGEIGDSNSVTVNDLASQGFATGMIMGAEDNPIGSGWFHALNMGWDDNATTWTSQLAIGTEHQDGLYYRTTNSSSGISGKPWKRVLDSSNYTNYALKAESLSDIDLNNVTTSGIYHLSGTLTNNPLSCNATLLVDFNVGTPYQIFMPDYTYNIYKRIYSSSTWGEWYEFGGSSSSSVAWDNITGRPSSYPPETHNHNTLDSDFGCTLPNSTTATYADLNSNGYTTGFFLKTIRGQYTAPGWFEGDYASGIAFGGADTHAVISCRYNFPRVTFAGGNGTEPNWWMRLAGTSGHSYNMDDFITTSGTSALSGSIVPNEDVGMELGDESHRFTNIYSSNITTDTIQFNNYDNSGNTIYYSGNDAANGNGGGLNNLVIRSWWGVSFTSPAGGGQYGGKNQTAVGIDCREGIVKAYNFEGLVNGHNVNADVPSNATYIASYGSSDNYVFSDCYGSNSGTNYYYIRYTNGIQMIFIEIHNDYGKYSHTQGSGKKTISFPVSFVNNKYFAFGKQNISSDGSGNNLVSFTEKNTSSICIRHYPYGYDESADYFSMFFVGRWK